MNIWIDGICKLCGSPVIETSVDGEESLKLKNDADYKNSCTNTKCKEFKWHFVADDEDIGYYTNLISIVIPSDESSNMVKKSK